MFLKRQVRWSGIPSLEHFSTIYCDPHSQRLGIVNKAEIDVFLELFCLFDDPADVGNLISGSPAFSKISLNISKVTLHLFLKPTLENFEHYFTSLWDDCNCTVVWAFFGIVFLWDWNENWPFPVLWPLLCFPKCLSPPRPTWSSEGQGTKPALHEKGQGTNDGAFLSHA